MISCMPPFNSRSATHAWTYLDLLPILDLSHTTVVHLESLEHRPGSIDLEVKSTKISRGPGSVYQRDSSFAVCKHL